MQTFNLSYDSMFIWHPHRQNVILSYYTVLFLTINIHYQFDSFSFLLLTYSLTQISIHYFVYLIIRWFDLIYLLLSFSFFYITLLFLEINLYTCLLLFGRIMLVFYTIPEDSLDLLDTLSIILLIFIRIYQTLSDFLGLCVEVHLLQL